MKNQHAAVFKNNRQEFSRYLKQIIIAAERLSEVVGRSYPGIWVRENSVDSTRVLLL